MSDKRIRLIDRLSIAGFPLREGAQIFIADDIQYLIDSDDSLDNNITLPGHTYGIVAPPFNNFWVEARTDPEYYDEENLLDVVFGCAITAHKIDEVEDVLANYTDFFNLNDIDIEEIGWVYFVKTHRYEEYAGVGKHLWMSTHTAVFPVTKDGLAVFADDGVAVSALEHSVSDLVEIAIDWDTREESKPEVHFHTMPSHMVASIIPLMLRTVNALHRKTEIIEVTVPRNFRRLMERKYNHKPASNYYLKVGDSPRRTYPTINVSTGSGSKKSTHYRVGHFKFYSEDRPHVSGFTGMMWANSTIVKRGQEITPKRYKVEGANDGG